MISCVFNLRTPVAGGGFHYESMYLTDRAPWELGWDTEHPPLIGDRVSLTTGGSVNGSYRVVDRLWWLPTYQSSNYRDGYRNPRLEVLVEEVKGMYADEVLSEPEEPMKESHHHD